LSRQTSCVTTVWEQGTAFQNAITTKVDFVGKKAVPDTTTDFYTATQSNSTNWLR
jgi:hypothetical protein